MKRIGQKWFFLRGLVRESGHWAGFLERFSLAFPNVEAIPLDLPGNGTRFMEQSPLSVHGITKVLRAEFESRKGESNHLFALSLGGMVGLDWMKDWPADFRSAVLVNTSVRGLNPLVHRLHPRNYLRILKMFFLRDPGFVEKSILEMTTSRTNRREELEKEWVRIHEARPVSSKNAARQLLAAARFHPPGEKPKVPILLLNGAGDRLVSPLCSEAISKKWEVELRTHPSAGHDLTLDEPDWVIEELRSWIARLTEN